MDTLDFTLLEEASDQNGPGIYVILNRKTNKFYIGSSKNIHHRWIEHKSNLNRNVHVNKKLQHSWNKNAEGFVLLLAEKCEESDLLDREQYYLDRYKPYIRDVGYNLNKKADGGDFYSLLSDEEKKEFVEKCIRKGEKNGMFGKKHTNDSIKKQKKKSKGRYTLNWFVEKYGDDDGKIKYEERRTKLSHRDMEYCRNNKLKGTKRGPYSEKHKKRISESRLKMKSIESDLKEAILSQKHTIKELEKMFGVSKPTILNRKRKYLK